VPEAGGEAARGNSADLEPQQSRRQESGFFQSLDAGVGLALPAPLCLQQPALPCPWLHVDMGHSHEALGCIWSPLRVLGTHFHSRSVCRVQRLYSQQRQRFDLRVQKGLRCQTWKCPTRSWAQQMDEEDARRAAATASSSRGDAMEKHGPAMAPPCPAPLPRPWLQPQDIVNAARPDWLAVVEAIDHIVQALRAQYNTVLTEEHLWSSLEWMYLHRRDVAWYLYGVQLSAGSPQWPRHFMASRPAPPRRGSASGPSKWCGGGALRCVG